MTPVQLENLCTRLHRSLAEGRDVLDYAESLRLGSTRTAVFLASTAELASRLDSERAAPEPDSWLRTTQLIGRLSGLEDGASE